MKIGIEYDDVKNQSENHINFSWRKAEKP